MLYILIKLFIYIIHHKVINCGYCGYCGYYEYLLFIFLFFFFIFFFFFFKKRVFEKKYISDDICSEIMSRIEEKQSNKID